MLFHNVFTDVHVNRFKDTYWIHTAGILTIVKSVLASRSWVVGIYFWKILMNRFYVNADSFVIYF